MTELRTLDDVVRVILAARVPERRTLVAVVGAPGAGKSTLAAELAPLVDAAVLPMDGFHLPKAELARLGRLDRMGAPDTFDVDGFLRTLTALHGNSGDRVIAPGFDRGIEEPVPDAIDISPEIPCVIVEGNYLLLERFGWEAAAGLFSVRLFVEVDRDIRLERLIARHERFGKSPADARAWALGPDENNARLIEVTRARADHVIRL